MNKKTSKLILTATTLLSFSSVAFAEHKASMDFVDRIFASLLTTPGSLEDLIVKVLNWLIGASAVLCVVMLIVAGFLYMTSGGNEDKTQKATKTLTNAIIGLVICLVAVLLVNFVLQNFLGQK